MVSSKTNEWETPQWFFDELNVEFGFTMGLPARGDAQREGNYDNKRTHEAAD